MKKILLAACAVLAMTGAARGEVLGTAGAWTVSKSETTCFTHVAYTNWQTLVFGLQADGQAGITVVNRAWNIPKGSYKVKFWVDRPAQAELDASAEGNTVTVPYIISAEAVDLLSNGASMSLMLGNQVYKFDLTGSGKALGALINCATTQLVNTESNPFAGQSAPPAAPVSTPSNPFRRT
jgi:hypothetical protein